MRAAGRSHPEWGYLAPTLSVMPTIRVALVATIIGAIGASAVVVSLIERSGANADSTSIAVHAVVAAVPMITAPLPPLTTSALAHGPVRQNPAASVPPAPAPAPVPTTNASSFSRKANRSISAAPRTAVMAELPPRSEAQAATGDVRTDIAPAEKARPPAASRSRQRRHRRLSRDYSGRGYGRFGTMHDEW
jgi:hypothetical protein